jgi:hypothetical protein
MSQVLRKLDDELSRELALLRRLPPVTLSRAAWERLDARVRDEARRLRWRRRLWRPELAGLAAALALCALWGGALNRWTDRAIVTAAAAPDASEALGDWLDAFERSSDRVQTLLVSDWLDAADDDPDRAVDEIFEALRELEGIGA